MGSEMCIRDRSSLAIVQEHLFVFAQEEKKISLYLTWYRVDEAIMSVHAVSFVEASAIIRT